MLWHTKSAGVAPDVNLRITRWQRMQARDPPWVWNPGETQSEVQNRGISATMKRTCVLETCLWSISIQERMTILHQTCSWWIQGGTRMCAPFAPNYLHFDAFLGKIGWITGEHPSVWGWFPRYLPSGKSRIRHGMRYVAVQDRKHKQHYLSSIVVDVLVIVFVLVGSRTAYLSILMVDLGHCCC